MKKLLLFSLLAIILLTGCTKHEFVVKKQIKTRHFDYFELSYHGGWLGKLQFCVDSNHIYFSGNPGADFLDTIKYGILPDSIVKYIDTIVEKITKDTTIKSNHTYCHDCDNISIIIVRGQDTTKLFQDSIDRHVDDLYSTLDAFINTSKHTYLKSVLLLQTAKDVAPPPLPRIDKPWPKFLPPGSKSKN